MRRNPYVEIGSFAFAPHVDAGGPAIPQTNGSAPPSGASVPWRRASTKRSQITDQSTGTVSSSTQNVQITLDGSGYMTAVQLCATVTTSGNAAAVAYQEDAPFSFFDNIVLSDTSGEASNVTGYDQYLLNLYGSYWGFGSLPSNLGTTDTSQWLLTSGAVGTGGSFRFHLIVPVAINQRNFLGLLGNQDRAMKFQLRDDVASSASLYSVAPTTPGTFQIDRYYESMSVPNRTNTAAVPQEIYPRKYGVQHFQTRLVSPNVPVGGSTVNHQLARLGNTIRLLVLVFRSNGSRATAESNMPTRISFMLGDTVVFNEDTKYRRSKMFQRWGVANIATNKNDGVLAYDFMADILSQAGNEFGADWLWTAGLTYCQFVITYPSGFGSTNNSLVILTDDLIVPDSINVYEPDAI